MNFNLNLNSENVDHASPAEPLAVVPEAPVSDVFALMKAQQTGSVLVCRDGVLVGIFTERDALALMASGADLNVRIDSVMVPNPVSISSEETVGAAIRKMAAGGYRRLPLVDDQGQPQGVLKVSGIVSYLVEHFPQTVYNLPPEPNSVISDREGA